MTPGKPQRIALLAIACLQGGFMVTDGVHVLLSHRYLGGQAGPWTLIVRKMGFNEYDMGPVFVGLGALWLLGGVLNFAGLRAGAATLVLAAVISLLYPLFGTALSLVTLVVLWRQRVVSKTRTVPEER